MLARAITPALKSGELPGKEENKQWCHLSPDDNIKEKKKKRFQESKERGRMRRRGLSLLSRLMRGSTALAFPEAASGSHFLYFSTEQRYKTRSEKHSHQANKVTERNLLNSAFSVHRFPFMDTLTVKTSELLSWQRYKTFLGQRLHLVVVIGTTAQLHFIHNYLKLKGLVCKI